MLAPHGSVDATISVSFTKAPEPFPLRVYQIASRRTCYGECDIALQVRIRFNTCPPSRWRTRTQTQMPSVLAECARFMLAAMRAGRFDSISFIIA